MTKRPNKKPSALDTMLCIVKAFKEDKYLSDPINKDREVVTYIRQWAASHNIKI